MNTALIFLTVSTILLLVSIVLNIFYIRKYVILYNRYYFLRQDFKINESYYIKEKESLKNGYENQIKELKSTYNSFAEKTISEFHNKAVNSAKVAAQDIANALIKNNKESNNELKKESSDTFKKVTDEMYKNIQDISNVSFRNRQIMESIDKDNRKLLKAFSSGIDSGAFCEQHLEQRLKNFGFISGQDYILQYSTIDGKRPDAIVFLPNNQYLVIDCKSSKFFIKEENISDEQHSKNILKSVKKHISDISSKSYIESVKKDINSYPGRSSDSPICYTVMYLPNDKIYYDIIADDPSIGRAAIDKNIVIAGPVSFEVILHNSRSAINVDSLSKNFEKEKSIIKALTEGIIDACRSASEIGDGIQKTISAYEKFIKTADPDGKFVKKLNNASEILQIDQKGLDKIQKIKYFGVISDNRED